MVRWAMVCLLLVFLTSVFGFMGIAAGVAGLSRFLFSLSIIALVSLLAGSLLRPPKV